MRSILKYGLIALLVISTTAYAGNKKKKQTKKAHCTMNCPVTCPRTGSCH